MGSESEKASFLKDPNRYLRSLDQAVIALQTKDYPLTTCPVSKDKLGGDMSEAVDVVVGGRLVRVCCNDCVEKVEQEPAIFIAQIDAARKTSSAHKEANGGKPNTDK